MSNFKMYSTTLFLILIHLKYSNAGDGYCPGDSVYIHSKIPYDDRIDNVHDECENIWLPNDCATATSCTQRSGIYKIRVTKFSDTPFYVLCDDRTDNGDWLLIQRRHDGSIDFYRTWDNYENGFGDIDGEFFIGLKKLHALTNYNGAQELLIVMEKASGSRAYAKYDSFAIGNKSQSYHLMRIGRFSGNAGNSLVAQMKMKFTTKDRDNDLAPHRNCAQVYKGAWWYKNCHESNLNGLYGNSSYGMGVIWSRFTGFYESLVYVKMMIRRRNNV